MNWTSVLYMRHNKTIRCCTWHQRFS